jgi:hypothetical protein
MIAKPRESDVHSVPTFAVSRKSPE